MIATYCVSLYYTHLIHIFLSSDWLKCGHMTLSFLLFPVCADKSRKKYYFPGISTPLKVLTNPGHLLHYSRTATACNSRAVCCRCESMEEMALLINQSQNKNKNWLDLRRRHCWTVNKPLVFHLVNDNLFACISTKCRQHQHRSKIQFALLFPCLFESLLY